MAVSENVSSSSLSAMWDGPRYFITDSPSAISLLNTATDLLVLERDFTGAIELCERGLQLLEMEAYNRTYDQVKSSLMVIAIQALVEVGRWREVLSWLQQYYLGPQEIPHYVMEMCLLLYSRVKQPHVMLQLSRDWLDRHWSRQTPQYKRVAEMYILNVLLPLGHFAEAEQMAQDPHLFTKEQQEVALTAVRTEQRRLEREEEDRAQEERLKPEQAVSPAGDVGSRCAHVARLVYGALNTALSWARRIPLRTVLLTLLLLSVILLRLDPASPASQGPLSRLVLLFRQIFAGLSRNR